MRATISFLILALLALCGTAAAPQALSAPGLTVVRDAEAGELRAPTAAELRAQRSSSSATARQAPAQPQAITGGHGESSVVLGERKLVYAVVKRGADGKLDHHCVDGAQGDSRHDHR